MTKDISTGQVWAHKEKDCFVNISYINRTGDMACDVIDEYGCSIGRSGFSREYLLKNYTKLGTYREFMAGKRL